VKIATSRALARALAPSPTAVDDAVIASSRALAPAAIIEVVTFIALLQMLHRLESYFAPEHVSPTR
jgi:hypothetical protein